MKKEKVILQPNNNRWQHTATLLSKKWYPMIDG